jgi:hypothetical protein
MVVLTLQGTIPTNTPAFQEYATREMFGQASNMIVCWNLDLPRPLTTNAVTKFLAEPSSIEPQGLINFSNRFVFSWLNKGAFFFRDETNDIARALTPDVKVNDAIFEEWMRATNLLTMQKAWQIAESSLRSLGFPVEKLDFKNPKDAHQENYRWTDGKVYPLPLYEFYWRTSIGSCEIHLSGINGKLAYFDYIDYTGKYPHFQKPTNYFEMLGIPTNAVFVHRLFLPGKPPLYELREPMPPK